MFTINSTLKEPPIPQKQEPSIAQRASPVSGLRASRSNKKLTSLQQPSDASSDSNEESENISELPQNDSGKRIQNQVIG